MAMEPNTPTTQPNISAEAAVWLDELRQQAQGQHWSLTISGTPDGAESVEVLHSKDRPIRDGISLVAGGERTVVCRKTPQGTVIRPLRQVRRKGFSK